jgi:hypothetical protein
LSAVADSDRNDVRGKAPRRFDIVVWNFDRVELFLDNFARITNFDPARDRITVVSASPSPAETQRIRRFQDDHRLSLRYLTRRNRGGAELARAQYFTGLIGSRHENLNHAYIFQMQDHYLDTTSDTSRWGPELDFGTKGDVVPDGASFDLDRMEELAEGHDLRGFFCDRDDPCFISLAGRRYIAPNGGNFTIRSDAVRDASVQEACRRLLRTCDDSYGWALYAEFMWGVAFFPEGERFYDLKRERLFDAWEREEFCDFPLDFRALKRFYERPAAVRALIRVLREPRSAAAIALQRALPENAYRGVRAAYHGVTDPAKRRRWRARAWRDNGR